MVQRSSLAILSAGVFAASLGLAGMAAAAPPAPSDFNADQLPELGEATAVSAQVGEPRLIRVSKFSTAMSVAHLCSNPRAKAVLDSDLPGLTTRPEYPFFKNMSLRRLKSMSGGKMTDADLAKVDAELALLEDAPPATEQ